MSHTASYIKLVKLRLRPKLRQNPGFGKSLEKTFVKDCCKNRYHKEYVLIATFLTCAL